MASAGLEALELKARSAQITRALEAYLPADFAAACELLLATLHPDTGGVSTPRFRTRAGCAAGR